jgi:hypothetical protein
MTHREILEAAGFVWDSEIYRWEQGGMMVDYFVAANGNWATLSKSGSWQVFRSKVTVEGNCRCQSWVVRRGRSLSGLAKLVGGSN